MSGPYRFNQEQAKSPLDRTTSPFSAGQPVSFKTNVNRMKTKKWVTAKKNAYDGDDWGEYDEYDEYGVDQEPPQPEPPASNRYYAQPQRSNTDRSFTEPIQQGPPGKARRNSFEAGEEHRAFSASIPQPPQSHPQQPQQGYGQQPYGDPQRQASGADSDLGRDPHDRRDFVPSAMPPPLQTRVSPMPSDIQGSPSATQFPPRKSSVGQAESPLPLSPRSPGGSHADKPLPFIRPADIYRRVEEERERERASLDSSRPSLDSLSSRPKDDLQSPTTDVNKGLQPLETVPERKSEYLPDFNVGLPPSDTQKPITSQGSSVSPSNDQSFRSVVDQAFTRIDEQHSIPPTPVSKESETDMSRSNTGSTSGISPIMSRVPSTAASAVKRAQAGGEGSTPVIAEEPHEPSTNITQPTPATSQAVGLPATSKGPLDHTRNLSSSSLPRSGLATPTRGDSPARSPIVAPLKDIPGPTAAHISNGSPDKSDPMAGGLSGPSSAYATRESDIASAVKGNLSSAAPDISTAEKTSQDAFLESHHAQSSVDDALPRSRSESPSKGRVQALAGKFGDVSHSRRGSTQSNGSVQSWERSNNNSRAPSPTKGSPSKPSSPVKEFRPHLPGQWESFATTAATPSDQADKEKMLGATPADKSLPQGDIELTPTTAKHPVTASESESASDPVSALKSAGAAMAQSFKTTVGLDNATGKDSETSEGHTQPRAHGNFDMPRPLQLDRTASSISSLPPTPPAKDSPTKEHPPAPPAKDLSIGSPAQDKRSDALLQSAKDASGEDEESDRLRNEIVASLSPVRSLDTTTADHNRTALQPSGSEAQRSSSVLPAEYDSYWADGGRGSSFIAPGNISSPDAAAVPSTPPSAKPQQSGLLNRFSWEATTPQLMTPEQGNKAAVPEPTKSGPDGNLGSPVADRAAEEERQQWSKDLPKPPTEPEHSIIVTKAESIKEKEQHQGPRSPTSPGEHDSLTREQTRSPGLHVVNSAVDPEAVDLPPRLSADLASPTVQDQDGLKSVAPEAEKETPNPAISTTVPAPEPTVTSPTQAPPTTSPTTDKPLGAREIATINSTTERISTYNKTRDHWAHHDHGLESWLASTLEANPELASQIPTVQRTTTGTVRHKHTGSLSLLGKLGGASVHHLPGSEHNNSGPSQQPVSGGSPTAPGPSSSGGGFDRRVASAQMQMKGKDLLHSAGALSGKGLTSAKGLFAKGKSRFAREKVEK